MTRRNLNIYSSDVPVMKIDKRVSCWPFCDSDTLFRLFFLLKCSRIYAFYIGFNNLVSKKAIKKVFI